MTNGFIPSARDEALLRLLDHTPATTALILKACETFPGEPFRDERRVRERLRTLADSGLVRPFPATHGIGGPVNWYKLTPEGFRCLHGIDRPLPPRSWFEAISPSRFQHTQVLSEVIVHTIVSAHRERSTISYFSGDRETLIEAGSQTLRPDCFFQFSLSGKQFNVYFEIDQSTESVNSHSEQSIRTKLVAYERCQDSFIDWWKSQGERGPRPYFRVAFLTRSRDRAYHILWLAGHCAVNSGRRLVYAATQESFLAEQCCLQAPLFLDHHGHWQALVNLHPSSNFRRTPVRLTRPVTPPTNVW